MPNYTPTTDTFHATIPNCADGDAAISTVFNQGGNAAADNAAYLNAKLSALYAGGTLTPADTLTIANSVTGHATRVEGLVVEEDIHVEGVGQFDDDVTVDGDLNNAVTTPFRDGGNLDPSSRLLFGTNVATALYVTSLTNNTGANIGSAAFRRMYTHLNNSGSEIVDTLDDDSAVDGDWVMIRQAGANGISVKTEAGPTEIAVLGPAGTNDTVGFFYFLSGDWHLGWLASTSYST
jgi:hypothetical protein